MIAASKALLTPVVLVAFALTIACGTSSEAQPVGRNEATAVQWPDSWPVPPLPTMALEQPRGLLWGSPSSYCWRFQETSDPVCEQYPPGSGVNSYPEVVPDRQVPIRIESEATPDKMFGQVYTRHGNILVDFLRLGTVHPVLDLDLAPGDYHVRLEGQWQYNDTSNYIERQYNTVGYLFGLSVPGAVALISECGSTAVGGDVRIVLISLDDQLRTAMDRVNLGGCRFNKPIARISLTLNSVAAGTYTETFYVDPPSLTVSFPLPDDLASERVGEPLPPGEYSRRMVALTADGEEREITFGDDFLNTVTIAGH